MWRSDVCHLLPVCCVHSVYWSQIYVLGNTVFAALFLWKSVCFSHLCTFFIAAGRQASNILNSHLTPQACKWQFLSIRPQCCLKRNVTWNQYTTVLSGGKFKYSVVTACNNCCLVLLTEYRNWFKCAVEAFSWIYGKCYHVSVMYHLPECKGKGRFVPVHCMKAYGCMAPFILKLGSWWGCGSRGSLAALPVVKSRRYTLSRRLHGPQCLLRRGKSLVSDYFPCFFLSCKANARVQPAETGHGPHSSKLFVFYIFFCVVLCIVCV
jgi:hypothetical protein